MKVLRQLSEFKAREPAGPVCLAIGAFDGIHIGHQALFRYAVECAKAQSGEAWALTFSPHPSRVLCPGKAPALLTSNAHKLRCMEPLGLAGCINQPFTLEMATWEPLDFLERLRDGLPGLHAIFVGFNWRFGCGARGDVDLLKTWAAEHQIEVIVPDPVEWNGELVSSTRIRKAVENGDLDEVQAMLGRPFSLFGVVRPGHRVARELGFPTANIQLQDEVRPPIGVYAAQVIYDGTLHNGAAYLGLRKSEDGEDEYYLLEVHLFDAEPDLYGKTIEVFFLKYLRKDKHFTDRVTLKESIARDVAQARAFFSS